MIVERGLVKLSVINWLDTQKSTFGLRNIRLFLSIATSVIAKFVAIGSTLITIPLTLNYLGDEAFGVWMVISSVLGFISFSDLGIGMGLQNAISRAYGNEDKESPKHYIANAYALATLVALSLIMLFLASYELTPIEMLFNMKNDEQQFQASVALKFTIVAFLVGIPISLIQRVLGGNQKVYIANAVMLVGSIVSLISIFFAVHCDLGLLGLTLGFVLSPILCQLVFSFYYFYRFRNFRPRFINISRSHFKPIISIGLWAVLARVVFSAKMNTPTIIISSVLGTIAVAEYSIAQKLAGLVATSVSMALQPLWVTYGEAYHRGDSVWVKGAVRTSLKLVLISTVFAALTFQLVGQWLIELWVGPELVPSRLLIGCFSVWTIARTVNVSYAMLLNGTSNLKNHTLYNLICVLLAIVLLLVFTEGGGLVSVIVIMATFSELICIPFYYRQAQKVIRRMPVGSKAIS